MQAKGRNTEKKFFLHHQVRMNQRAGKTMRYSEVYIDKSTKIQTAF